MKRVQRDHRRVMLYLTIALVFILALGLFSWRHKENYDEELSIKTNLRTVDSHSSVQALSSNGKRSEIRDQSAGRAGRGIVPEGGVNRPWNFIVVKDIHGNPQSGDEAYVSRLGPVGGLLTVESVEGDSAIMSFVTLESNQIREGDRVDTMPPLKKQNKAEMATPRKPSD